MTSPETTDGARDLGHGDDMASRIVAAATTCFYRDGIWATGVDAVAAEAGFSKRALYNHFGSKDGVIAAYLRHLENSWQANLDSLCEEIDDNDAIGRVVAYVHAYGRPVEPERFRGSAFMNAAAELADEQSEAIGGVQHSLDRMEAGIASILEKVGYADPLGLGRLIVYLLEGAA